MTRSQLIARLAQRREALSRWDVETAVKTMLEHLAGHLANGGRIEIRDFGSFSVRYRRPRLGRNPRTGAAVARPAGHVVHFKPGRAADRLMIREVEEGAHRAQGSMGRLRGVRREGSPNPTGRRPCRARPRRILRPE